MNISNPIINDLNSLDLNALEPSEWHLFNIRYGARVSGEALTFPVGVIAGLNKGPRVSIVAGVHGDEFEGVRALWELIQESNPHINSGTLVVVPVANIPAYEAGTRKSPLDGLNLARIFPGHPNGLPSERLAYALFHQVVVGSDLLVDLHSGGRRYLHLPLAGFYDVPGELGMKSLGAAKVMGWTYLWAAPHRSGVLSYEAIKHGIPAIGTEAGGAGRCLLSDVANYLPTFRRLLHYSGLLESDPPEVQTNSQCIIDGDWYICSRSGFLETKVELGQPVKKGILLGKIFDTFGQVQDTLYAQHDGVIVGVRSFPSIQEGEWSIFVGVKP